MSTKILIDPNHMAATKALADLYGVDRRQATAN